MADNTIIIGGATQPSTINTPGDKRERVATFSEIDSIDNPAIGGTVWVEDEEKEYRIISLKSKVIGGVEIQNAAVGEVVPESAIISREITKSADSVKSIAGAIASDVDAINSISNAIASDENAINTMASAIAEKTGYDEESGRLVLL